MLAGSADTEHGPSGGGPTAEDTDRATDTDQTHPGGADDGPGLPAPRVLRDYQIDAVAAVEKEWDSGLQRTSVILPTGAGKAITDDTPVNTPRGVVEHGDLCVGDQVYGPDGLPRTITHVHPQGVIDVFCVTFSDGTALTVSGNHLWQVDPGNPELSQVRSTLDLAADLIGGNRSWYLPGSCPIPLPEATFPVPPAQAGDTVRRRYSIDAAMIAAYATGSIAQRVDFLNALLDGASTFGGTCIRIRTASYDGVRSLRHMIWSLGGIAEVTAEPCTEYVTEYTLYIDLPPVDGLRVPVASAPPRRSIRSITPAGRASCQCITVDAPDGLYLAGEQNAVTHNSTVIAKLADQHRGEGVVMLAHRAELINQMSEAVAAVNPSAPPVGKVIADYDEPDAEIVAASFQTLSRSPERLKALGKRGLILVDECHHSLADTYLKVLSDLGLNIDTADLKTARESDVVRTGVRQDILACGFTATMSRADSLKLGKVWHSVAYERDLVWGLDNKFLIPPVGKTIRSEALNKLASIKQVAGDYNKGELEEVMTASVGTTIDGIIEHAQGRSILVFAASVEHARSLSSALTRAGVRAASVTGNDKEDRREAVYAAFRSGALDAMVTVQVLTEGADFPRCDAVVLARPTRSRVLLTQIIGRCVRPYTYDDGTQKTDALVLDLTGVVRDSKMVSLSELWGGATTSEFTEDGREFVPPPPPAPKKPKKQRVGKATVEDIDLYDRQSRYRNILWVTSPSDVVFMPGREGREAFVLWPPKPATAEACNLLQINANGAVSVFRGADGTPVRATFEEAVQAANDFALESRNYVRVTASWRGSGRRPTAAQKRLAGQLGLRVFGTDTTATLSDRITAALLDQALMRARIPATTL